MEGKAAGLLVLVAALVFGSKRSPPKLSPGGRVLLIGDSQSVPGGPGAFLAELLRKAGYPTEVFAVGGKTAKYFVSDGFEALKVALAKKPAATIVFLGSNELANVALTPAAEKGQIKGHQALRDILLKSGTLPLFVGPPRFRPDVKSKDKNGKEQGEPLEKYTDSLTPRLESVWRPNFLDARPMTPDHAGIHFNKNQSEAFARSLIVPVLKALGAL